MGANNLLWILLCGISLLGISCSNDDIPENDSPGVKTNIVLSNQQRSIVEYGNNFANEMLVKTIKENENILISPFSLQVVLGMLANGADEEAYNEIVSTLGLKNYSQTELNEYFQKMSEGIIGEEDPKVELALANSMWIQNEYSINGNFKSGIQQWYEASINHVDFNDLGKVRTAIDQWAREATNSTIKELGLPINESTIMVLANAIYFSGKWASPFNEKNTSNGTFICEDGTTQTVPFMHGLKKKATYMETEDYQWVSLPFGNESFSMIFLLPKEGKDLADVLPGAEWKASDDAWNPSVNMALPRFKLETVKQMKETLDAMGISKIFTQNSLPGIAENLCVSFVQQNAYLEIEESGVKAAAVTSSGVLEMSPEITLVEMNLNRPFAFAISENSSDAILFMGKIAKIK
jgi:serpin B